MSQISAINDNCRPPGADRRVAARRRVLFTGKLIALQTRLTTDCTIRDLSFCGARILAALPPENEVGSALIVVRRACLHQYALVWRREAVVGLRFLNAVDLRREETLPADLIHARDLWLSLAPR